MSNVIAAVQPVGRTTGVHFGLISNTLATLNAANQRVEYELFGFDAGFTQHFSESTFGVNIPFVFFGFDVTVRAAASLSAAIELAPGELGISYDLAVADIRATNGVQAATPGGPTAAFINQDAVNWVTDYGFVGADLTVTKNPGKGSAGLYLDYDFGIAVNNIVLGVDFYIKEFKTSPFTLIDFGVKAEDYPIFAVDPAHPVLNESIGPFQGILTAPTGPRANDFAADIISGAGPLKSISIEGVSADAFATLSFDIAKFISSFLPIQLSGSQTIFSAAGGNLTFEYTIISVSLESTLKVGQKITFAPSGVGVSIDTYVKTRENGSGFAAGQHIEHLEGQLGDTFTFQTPASGAGEITAKVDYTLNGTLESEGQLIAAAGVNVKALGFALTNTIIKDFKIGVGPLIDYDIPEGGIPIGSIDAYHNLLPVAIRSATQTFDFYWEQPIDGTPGPDVLHVNDNDGVDANGDGTPETPPELLRGYAGADRLDGNQWGNLIRGDGDNDTILGGAGNDSLRGEDGDDLLYGEAGADVAQGGAGNDQISGGDGNDFLVAGNGDDVLFGDAGNDVLNSADISRDYLVGGDGLDRAVIDRRSAFKGEIVDFGLAFTGQWRTLADGTRIQRDIEYITFQAGNAADAIATAGDNNAISGGGGDDFLRSRGKDTFSGQAGDDQIAANWASGGTYDGGAGTDRIILTVVGGTELDINLKDIFAGTETVSNATTIVGFENASVFAGGADDRIHGSDGNDILHGAGGDDRMFSELGSDQLFGEDGNDTLTSSDYPAIQRIVKLPNGRYQTIAPAENDLIDGGAGIDTVEIVRSSAAAFRLDFDDDGNGKLSDGTRLISIERLLYVGGSGIDLVRGSAGDDRIATAGGTDVVDGGAGIDAISGQDGDDYLIAAAGEFAGDAYFGNDGIDTADVDFSGVAHGVTLNGASGADILLDGLISLSGFERYRILGTAFADILIGGGADAAAGEPFADDLDGASGDDVIDGGAGHDAISGGDGNDRLFWSEGGDQIDGGGDDDQLVLDLTGDSTARTIALLAPDITSTIVEASVVNVERLYLIGGSGSLTVTGGLGSDILFDSSANDFIDGRDGDDGIRGHAGDDTLYGGTGDDDISDDSGRITILGQEGDDVIAASGGGTSTLSGGDGADVINSARGITDMQGGAGNDVLHKLLSVADMATQGAGIDRLDGGDGDDRIISGYRATLIGGAGTDTLELTGGATELTVDVRDPTLVKTLADGGSYTGFEILAFAGGAGNDTVFTRAKFGALDGGGGIDQVTLDFRGLRLPVTAAAVADGSLTIGDGSVRGFEVVTLRMTDANESIVLRSIDNRATLQLYGEAGDDTLGGGAASDFIDGGAGVDVASFRGTKAQYTISQSNGVVTVTDNVAGRDASDRLINIEYLRFSDGLFDIFRGVTVQGTVNNDIIDTTRAPAGQPLPGTLDDYLYGGAGSDSLNGGAGRDRMYGGTGDDYYFIDDTADVAIEFAGEGNDTVYAAVTYQLGANIENAQLSGSASVDLYGSAGANFLRGNDGDNRIDGGAGADTMTGLGGNDTYVVDNIGDVIGEGSGLPGYDTVEALIATYTLPTLIEALTFANYVSPNAIAGVTGSGNDLANAITGSAWDDELYGLAANDTLIGGDGDDFLIGGAGNDIMIGGDGDDIYAVDDAGDQIVEDPGAGYDAVQSSVDYERNDLVSVERVTLIGAATRVRGNIYTRQITGNDLANDVIGGSGAETIDGRGGADSINGGDGDDTILGGAGDDVIGAGNGNDSIDGGLGADSMNGNLGDDTYVVDDAGDYVSEVDGQGYDTVRVSLASFVLAPSVSVERIVLIGAAVSATGNSMTREITGSALANTLTGSDWFETIDGGAGADMLRGNGGNDILIGGAGADLLEGGGDDDRLQGGLDNDELAGGAGSDTVAGGLGDDLYRVDDSLDLVVERVGEGNDRLISYAELFEIDPGAEVETLEVGAGGVDLIGNDYTRTLTGNALGNRLVGGENAQAIDGGDGDDRLSGGGGGDMLTGGLGADQLDGGGGNDVLDGGEGSDRLVGGLGNDTYLVSTGNDVIVELADGGRDRIVTTFATLALGANIEDALYRGTAFSRINGNALGNMIDVRAAAGATVVALGGNDTILGSALADNLQGGDGDDQIDAGIGNDRADGGSGVDMMSGGAGNDVVTAGAGDDRAEGGDGNDMLSGGDGGDVLLGGAGADRLSGDAGNDLLDGGTGADRMTGGAGDDTYVIDNAGDVAVETTNGGIDTINTALASITLAAGIERALYTGAGKTTFIGNAADNVIDVSRATTATVNGGNGNDMIVGSNGRDLLAGGAGDDAIAGGALADRIDGGAGADVIAGGSGNDTVFGGDGNDVLDGGAGADRLVGGAGDDRYIVDDARDAVIEAAGGGTDTIETALARFVFRADIENFVWTGTGTATVIGNDANNVIDAAASHGAVLRGGGGDDILIGGAGTNEIEGGAGADTLSGGFAADRFVFQQSAADGATDTIARFARAEGDVIDLSRMDADVSRAGNQGFTVIGATAFGGVAGELRIVTAGGVTTIGGDIDGDGDADFTIVVQQSAVPIAAGDFLL